jgi:hypothetical protein
MPKTKKKRATTKKKGGGAKKITLGGSYPVRGTMGGGGGPYFITQAPPQQLPPSALELELQKEKLATQKAKTETIYEEARARIVEREVNADIMKREAEARMAQGKVEHELRMAQAKADVAIGTTESTIQAAQAKADVATGTVESTIRTAEAKADVATGTAAPTIMAAEAKASMEKSKGIILRRSIKFEVKKNKEKAKQEEQKTRQMEIATTNQDIDTKVKKAGYLGRAAKTAGAMGLLALSVGATGYMGPGPAAEAFAETATGTAADLGIGAAKGYAQALGNRTEDVRETSEAATNATLKTAGAALRGVQQSVEKQPWEEAAKNVTDTVLGTTGQILRGVAKSVYANTEAAIRSDAQLNPSLVLNAEESPAPIEKAPATPSVIIPEYPYPSVQIDPSKIDTSGALQIYEHPLIRKTRQAVPGTQIPTKEWSEKTKEEGLEKVHKELLDRWALENRNLRGVKMKPDAKKKARKDAKKLVETTASAAISWFTG